MCESVSGSSPHPIPVMKYDISTPNWNLWRMGLQGEIHTSQSRKEPVGWCQILCQGPVVRWTQNSAGGGAATGAVRGWNVIIVLERAQAPWINTYLSCWRGCSGDDRGPRLFAMTFISPLAGHWANTHLTQHLHWFKLKVIVVRRAWSMPLLPPKVLGLFYLLPSIYNALLPWCCPQSLSWRNSWDLGLVYPSPGSLEEKK